MDVLVTDYKGQKWQGKLTKEPTTPTKKYVGWRCLHAAEGGYQSDPRGMPEIRPAYRIDSITPDVNPAPVLMTQPIQLLSWDMNGKTDSPGYNDTFTKPNWRAVYGTATAFTNNQGFGEDPNKRDWVTPQDTNNEEDPKLMKGLICGGAFILDDGYDNDWIYVSPGVSAVPADGPYPTYKEIFNKLWYYEATTMYNGKMSHFPQGHGKPVWIPYVLRERCKFPRSWFQRWEEDFLPDPLSCYNGNVPFTCPQNLTP